MKEKTLIRPLVEGDTYFNKNKKLFMLGIDESAGDHMYHEHEFGHDFPITEEELLLLKTQIENVLAT